MREDSPPQFITIRTPRPKPVDVYATALELSAAVHRVLEAADKTRFHLKDRLDRCVSALVIELARADANIKPGRWRHYRAAHKLAIDAAAVLDILHGQHATPADHVEAARVTSKRLCLELQPLTLG